MTNISKIHIGVDISKNSLDIHIHPLSKPFKITNSRQEITKFIKELAQYNVAQIVCEATGGYEKLLAQLLKKHDYNVWIVDPRRIKGFITATGGKCKTDKIDARKIAEFSSQNTKDYQGITKTKTQDKLCASVNRKNNLTKVLATEKNRLKHPSHALSFSSIKKIINVLKREIRAVDRQICNLIENDNDLYQKSTFLESIPGIGKSSAALLLAHIPELGQLSNRKVSALIGVCPYNNESGKYEGKRFIKGGRVTPRNALYMCALTTIKHNLILKAFYDRLIENKKPFKIAIVAVMHKLIILANAVLKKGELCKV